LFLRTGRSNITRSTHKKMHTGKIEKSKKRFRDMGETGSGDQTWLITLGANIRIRSKRIRRMKTRGELIKRAVDLVDLLID